MKKYKAPKKLKAQKADSYSKACACGMFHSCGPLVVNFRVN